MKTILLALILAIPGSAAASEPAFTVKVTGHGRPMILIPGLASSGETWDSTVARYKDRFECHVFTLAGFAGVPAVPVSDQPMLERARDQIAAYILDKKLEKPVIAGHSLGGFLALSIASKYPERTGPLVIVDAYPALPAIFLPDVTAAQIKQMAEMTKQMLANAKNSDESTRAQVRMMVTKDADFERVMAWGRASDKGAVADAMVEMYGTDLRDEIAKIRVPVLVLATWIAYKDFTTREKTEANARRQYAKLAGVDIRFTDTARHFIMYDDPEWFFAQIDGFLKETVK